MRREIKGIVITLAIVVWTLMCIYGTYDNTVRSAEIVTMETGYIVTYHNTGDVFEYTN